MKTVGYGRFASYISIAGALLAGCGGSQSPVVLQGTIPAQAQARFGPAASAPDGSFRGLGYKAAAPLLYVTNYAFHYNDVRLYRARAKNPAPLATISNGIDTPSGDCIDGHGTLYVTNQPSSGGGWISEYPLGKTSPSAIIKDGVAQPAFCAIDAKGNLWITNLAGPNVTEYVSGSKKPHTVITKDLTFPVGIAIDHFGNLYVANGWGASERNIEVYAPGSKSPYRTITDGVTWPVGIAVDSNATLYVTNAEQNNVEEYRSDQDYPFQTITDGMDAPVGVAVNKKGWLYVANFGNSMNVVEFPPGSVTPSKRQISKGLYGEEGVAYYPPLLP